MLKSESGASAVEFALVSPLLFVLTFGIIEFGLLLYDYAVITNASREGARAAVVYREPIVSTKDITDIVIAYANEHGRLINLGVAGPSSLTEEDVDVIPLEEDRQAARDAGGNTSVDVEVQVNYTYNFLVLPDLTKLIGGNFETASIPLKAYTKMRME
ncbi:TadE/TadG family type IV pilus assembly protein [Desulfosediminicola ganghwensis]|uniref:TadE/TadG family type IV pilus assembly protein n=1 Tax=Desulfosediminicola ganghwensis TaxID=2569540 RepID=UPI001C3C4FCB|nr:TadE/TadG family type IV pilus assembly protein [Desulfosediminicola ganghwensis]